MVNWRGDGKLKKIKRDNELYAADGEYPPGRPHAHTRNFAHQQQAQVRKDDHVAKLKLVIPPFEGRYNHDAYLTWELEVE